MPYKISWYIENRVMLIEVSGRMNLEEFSQLHRESFEYLKQSNHTVHAIADLRQFEAIPTNVRMLSSAVSEQKDHKQGMTVIVPPRMPGLFRFVSSMIMQTLRLEYRICDSTDDAYKILRNIDVDLVALSPSLSS